jgi:hypothetical protein
MRRPPGRLTVMSGLCCLPSSVVMVSCSTKSQCADMPANSAVRRRVISPHRPRTCGARRAVTKLPVRRLDLRGILVQRQAASGRRSGRRLALRDGRDRGVILPRWQAAPGRWSGIRPAWFRRCEGGEMLPRRRAVSGAGPGRRHAEGRWLNERVVLPRGQGKIAAANDR